MECWIIYRSKEKREGNLNLVWKLRKKSVFSYFLVDPSGELCLSYICLFIIIILGLSGPTRLSDFLLKISWLWAKENIYINFNDKWLCTSVLLSHIHFDNCVRIEFVKSLDCIKVLYLDILLLNVTISLILLNLLTYYRLKISSNFRDAFY